MPYNKDNQALLEHIHSIRELSENFSAIEQLMHQDMDALTSEERFKLLHDLSKLEPLVSEHTLYKEKVSHFIHKVIGHRKAAYLKEKYQSTYQLSGIHLACLVDHYCQKGIKIFIEGKVPTFQRDEGLSWSGPVINHKENAIHEIHHIQDNLDENKYVGYLYTNNMGDGADHVEAFIIGKNKIIKPIEWAASANTQLNFYGQGSCTTNLLSFCGKQVVPQAGKKECGTLSLSCLKNYLQDDAKQLKENTLCIPYYITNTGLNYFFFPSPYVTRYSQSELFNKYLKAMLINDDEYVRFNHKENNYVVMSLKHKLLQTIKKATERGHHAVKQEAESILENLPDFKEKWLEAYHRAEDKRRAMDAPEYNVYLAYTTQRMFLIANTRALEQHNPGLEVLRAVENKMATLIPSEEILEFLRLEVPQIGKELLCRFLKLDQPSWALELLSQYGDSKGVQQFLNEHHELLIGAMINAYTIYPLARDKKLQDMIQNKLEFFCPEGNQAMIAMYRSSLREVCGDQRQQQFLRAILSILPGNQRWVFMERLFGREEVEAIVKIKEIAKLLSIEEAIVTHKAQEDDDIFYKMGFYN